MMNSVIVETLYFVASYIGLFLAIFFGLNWLTKGFIWSYLRVKASQGKKILSRVFSRTDIYFTVGTWTNDGYKFKKRDKEKSIIADVPRDGIYPMCGVFCLDHSEDGRSVYSTDKERIVQSEDGRSVDNFLNRIAQAPQPQDKRMMILLGLIVLAVIVAAAAAYFGYSNYDALQGLEVAGVIQ